jgi:hypothetical protein
MLNVCEAAEGSCKGGMGRQGVRTAPAQGVLVQSEEWINQVQHESMNASDGILPDSCCCHAAWLVPASTVYVCATSSLLINALLLCSLLLAGC